MLYVIGARYTVPAQGGGDVRGVERGRMHGMGYAMEAKHTRV